MVPAEGLEPPTLGSEDRCSIQLSHAGTRLVYLYLQKKPEKDQKYPPELPRAGI